MTLSSSRQAVDKAIQDMSKSILDSCKNIQKLCKNFNLVDELTITLRQLETEAALLTSIVARKQADDFIKSIKNLIDQLSKQQELDRKTQQQQRKTPGGAFTGGATEQNENPFQKRQRLQEEAQMAAAKHQSELDEAKRQSLVPGKSPKQKDQDKHKKKKNPVLLHLLQIVMMTDRKKRKKEKKTQKNKRR